MSNRSSSRMPCVAIGAAHLILSTASLSAAVIDVPGDAPTIAAAIAMAADGDVIQLAPGTYADPFDVVKAVTIVGDPADPGSYRVRPIPAGRIQGEVLVPLAAGETAGFSGIELSGAVRVLVSGGAFHMSDCDVGAAGDLLPIVEGGGTDVTLTRCALRGAGFFAGTPIVAHAGSMTLVECSTPNVEFIISLLVAESCEVALIDCDVSGLAGGLTGAIDLAEGSLLVSGTSVHQNDWLPTIRTSGTAVRVEDSDFFQNVGSGFDDGSLIALEGGSVEIDGIGFWDNGAFATAPTIAITAPSISIVDSVFTDGIGSDNGPGLMTISGSFDIARCLFAGNSTLGVAGVARLSGTGSIADCTFSGNYGGDSAGALRTQGDVDLLRCRFEGNVAGDSFYGAVVRGGAVLVLGGSASFTECDFLGNVVGTRSPAQRLEHAGGAIASVGADLLVDRCHFLGNSALALPIQVPEAGRGGALSIEGGTATIRDSDFADNVAAGSGGAISSDDALTSVLECMIIGNTGFDGGGVAGSGGLVASTVCGNVPDDVGPGWSADGDTVSGCDVVQVPSEHASIQSAIDAVEEGGVVVVAPGLYLEGISLAGKAFTLLAPAGAGDTVLDGTGLTGEICRATQGETSATLVRGFTLQHGTSGHALGLGFSAGGALYGFESSPRFVDCRFIANGADFGGGAYLLHCGAELRRCHFEGNAAAEDGGAIQIFGGACVVDDCVLRGNEASVRGGGCHVVEGASSIIDTLIEENSAAIGGGISWSFNPPTPGPSPLALEGVVVRNNGAGVGGGLATTSGNVPPTLHHALLCGNVPEAVSGPYVDLGCNVVCGCACEDVEPLPDLDGDGILDCEDPCVGSCCPADLDGNRVVNGADMAILLGAWGSAGPGDLDGSGTVGGADLAALLGAWGPCPE